MDLDAANAELTRSRAAVQARYDLAVDAIKTFHTGVSEDFLLKEEKFKDLRNRLLKSASDFYGKLGALLGKETDPASRRALWQANFELAELTARSAARRTRWRRTGRCSPPVRRWRPSRGPTSRPRSTSAAASTAVAWLLKSTGKTDEAESTYRKAETLLADLARSVPADSRVRAVLAETRGYLGYLLDGVGATDRGGCHTRGVNSRPAALRSMLGRATWRPPPSWRACLDIFGHLLETVGRTALALASYEEGRTVMEHVAAAAADTTHGSHLAHLIGHIGKTKASLGRSGRGGSRVPKSDCDRAETGRRQPRRHSIPQRPGDQPLLPRQCAVESGQDVGGGGRVPQGDRDPAESGRRQPRRHRYRYFLADQPPQPRHHAVEARASWRRRRPSTARRSRSSRNWPTTTPPSLISAAPGGSHHSPRHRAVASTASRRRRRPSAVRRSRSSRSWPTTTPPSLNSAAAWRAATITSAACCR